MKNIYFFQWISDLGGADTRLKDLIQCLNQTNNYNLYSIPNDDGRLNEHHNTTFLKENNVKILKWSELPDKADGFAIAFCNFRLFSEEWRIKKIKSMGLKFIWSNDMMWSTPYEKKAIENNLIDACIFTSDYHAKIMTQKIPLSQNILYQIVPNYFNLNNYNRLSKKNYLNNKFVIGKLSRADDMKFSENFPLFYDKIPVENKHIRIMGFNQKLKDKYSWFNFKKENWEILSENSESINEFLSQLDVYVYTENHKYIENQSRAIIEAQLLGVPVIVPNYGNFPNMVWHGRTGFIYNSIEECYFYINLLSKDLELRKKLSKNAEYIIKYLWCDSDNQISIWENIFKTL